jgi:hypothetical protein
MKSRNYATGFRRQPQGKTYDIKASHAVNANTRGTYDRNLVANDEGSAQACEFRLAEMDK